MEDDTVTNFEEENNEKVQSDDDDSVMNEVDDISIDYNNSGAANADADYHTLSVQEKKEAL